MAFRDWDLSKEGLEQGRLATAHRPYDNGQPSGRNNEVHSPDSGLFFFIPTEAAMAHSQGLTGWLRINLADFGEHVGLFAVRAAEC